MRRAEAERRRGVANGPSDARRTAGGDEQLFRTFDRTPVAIERLPGSVSRTSKHNGHGCPAIIRFCCDALSCRAALAGLTGCASIWRSGRDAARVASTSARQQRRAAGLVRAEDEDEGFSWSDFNFDNLGKTTKKLVGQGPNRDIARKTFIARPTTCFDRRWRPSRVRRPHIFDTGGTEICRGSRPLARFAAGDGRPVHGGREYFFSDNYPQANVYYEKLVKAFPNNRYLDQVDQRRFSIARYWLDSNRAESGVVLLCQLVQQRAAVARCPRARAADFRQDSHR